jgi:hypothetical protein
MGGEGVGIMVQYVIIHMYSSPQSKRGIEVHGTLDSKRLERDYIQDTHSAGAQSYVCIWLRSLIDLQLILH